MIRPGYRTLISLPITSNFVADHFIVRQSSHLWAITIVPIALYPTVSGVEVKVWLHMPFFPIAPSDEPIFVIPPPVKREYVLAYGYYLPFPLGERKKRFPQWIVILA